MTGCCVDKTCGRILPKPISAFAVAPFRVFWSFYPSTHLPTALVVLVVHGAEWLWIGLRFNRSLPCSRSIHRDLLVVQCGCVDAGAGRRGGGGAGVPRAGSRLARGTSSAGARGEAGQHPRPRGEGGEVAPPVAAYRMLKIFLSLLQYSTMANLLDPPAVVGSSSARRATASPLCERKAIVSEYVFECPFCKQSIEAPPDMVGQLVDCPSCKKTIEVARNTPEWKRPPGTRPVSATAKLQNTETTRRKSAIGKAAQWAGGLTLGYIMFAPVSPELASDYSERLALRLVGGVALFPIIFFSIWAWEKLKGRRK